MDIGLLASINILALQALTLLLAGLFLSILLGYGASMWTLLTESSSLSLWHTAQLSTSPAVWTSAWALASGVS